MLIYDIEKSDLIFKKLKEIKSELIYETESPALKKQYKKLDCNNINDFRDFYLEDDKEYCIFLKEYTEDYTIESIDECVDIENIYTSYNVPKNWIVANFLKDIQLVKELWNDLKNKETITKIIKKYAIDSVEYIKILNRKN